MTDRELLHAILEAPRLTEREREAFQDMLDWLDGPDSPDNVTLSAKQREWASAVALAHGLVTEETQNLWSSGKVPRGIQTKKTRGEEKAAAVLANKPLRPPGRTT